jgi:phospholipid N-methyltransferase
MIDLKMRVIEIKKKVGQLKGIKLLKVRKKPVVVDAIEITEDFLSKLPIEVNGRRVDRVGENKVMVETLEGNMEGKLGDFLVIGVKGEIYPVRRDIFFKTYEIVNDGDGE